MKHRASKSDREFRTSFESGGISPDTFGHRAHVRLAYVYLVEKTTEESYLAMRAALHSFLARLGIESQKYHDTLTRAWVMAVKHFMEQTAACESADEFIDRNPKLLDSGIMLTHYSAGRLFSNRARGSFVEPDLEPIPMYDGTADGPTDGHSRQRRSRGHSSR